LSQYQVAKLILNVESDACGAFKRMKDYMLTQKYDAGLNFSFETKDIIDIPKGKIISDEEINIKWVKKDPNQDGYYLYTRNHGSVGDIIALMDVSADWRSAAITWSNISDHDPREQSYNQSQRWLATHILMGIVFRYYLLHYQGLVSHASALKWQGKCLLFSASSGTGKSTHVKLWQEYINDVTVLNDDTPAVRIFNNKPYVFGTPWSGTAFINSNDSAPLAAIILLEQSKENVIRKLSVPEAILSFMPRVFLPYFDESFMKQAMSIFEKIVVSVPVYLLKCRPDKEAVELVYQCMK